MIVTVVAVRPTCNEYNRMGGPRPVPLFIVLDYGITTLAGLPARQLNRLQSVINSAARLVYSARRSAVSYTHLTLPTNREV